MTTHRLTMWIEALAVCVYTSELVELCAAAAAGYRYGTGGEWAWALAGGVLAMAVSAILRGIREAMVRQRADAWRHR